MRCARLILAIITLLAAPLAMLAAGVACEPTTCAMSCCAMHGSHAQPGKGVSCQHDSSGKSGQCGTNSGNRMPAFGTIAPINPTTLIARITLAAPEAIRRSLVSYRLSTVSGFLSVPFEPPRA
jgi:hypothetical protein